MSIKHLCADAASQNHVLLSSSTKQDVVHYAVQEHCTKDAVLSEAETAFAHFVCCLKAHAVQHRFVCQHGTLPCVTVV